MPNDSNTDSLRTYDQTLIIPGNSNAPPRRQTVPDSLQTPLHAPRRSRQIMTDSSIKHVFKLLCQHCKTLVCARGMKAILLADKNIELYSTDVPSSNICALDKIYLTSSCHCRIQDVACLECGNIIGYHIVAPCSSCLNSRNNGHLWMFRSEECKPLKRYDTQRNFICWSNIPCTFNAKKKNVWQFLQPRILLVHLSFRSFVALIIIETKGCRPFIVEPEDLGGICLRAYII
ncbi:FAM72 protein-domain-containing protein [Cokeromyces recurvatus]|uniref:FAM72 protein-domain-containing protein n=1 Tax=Cokeromyces recurvatus TaxID=90255 RepID=UPI002220B8AD|nr:FAM72 protein-domain-containing protein [Cokeromyces recurvatus]KAI7898779.1 FAM72 protein-domain-containing protein [Cokeromyces recurvatus]